MRDISTNSFRLPDHNAMCQLFPKIDLACKVYQQIKAGTEHKAKDKMDVQHVCPNGPGHLHHHRLLASKTTLSCWKKAYTFFPNLTIVPSKPLIVASAMYALRFPLQEIDAHRVTVAEQEHPPHPLCTMLTPPVVFTQVCFCAREGYCMQIIVLTKEVGWDDTVLQPQN